LYRIIFFKKFHNYNYKRRIKKKHFIGDRIVKLKNNPINERFKLSGLNLNLYSYELIRTIIFALLIVLMMFYGVGSIAFVMLLVLYVLTLPTKNIGKFKAPLMYMLDALQYLHYNNVNKEIFNLASSSLIYIDANKKEPLSIHSFFEMLMKSASFTESYLASLLRRCIEGEADKGVDEFYLNIKNKNARDFAKEIVKFDDVDPESLVGPIQVLMHSIREDRVEFKNKIAKITSFVISVPVVFTMMLIFLDFIYTVNVSEMFNNYTNFNLGG